MTICWWVDPLGEACDWSWGWTARAGRWMVWQARWCQQLSARSEPWIFLYHLQIYRSVKLPTSPRVVGRTSHVCHLLGPHLAHLPHLPLILPRTQHRWANSQEHVQESMIWSHGTFDFLNEPQQKQAFANHVRNYFIKLSWSFQAASPQEFEYVSNCFNMFQCWPVSLCYPFGIPSVFLRVDSQLELRQGDWVPDPRKLPRGASCAGSNRMIPMMHHIYI